MLIDDVKSALTVLKIDAVVDPITDKDELESWNASEGVAIDAKANFFKCKLSRPDISPNGVNGYLAAVVVVSHNYPHEPDDVDVLEVEKGLTFSKIFLSALSIVLQERIDNYFENKMFEELEKEQS